MNCFILSVFALIPYDAVIQLSWGIIQVDIVGLDAKFQNRILNILILYTIFLFIRNWTTYLFLIKSRYAFGDSAECFLKKREK